ncbi:hypothetical protein EV356DRAFT_510555 [Viridothelium virens]|uniref:STE24 endopeptidase n=1 Tax=Viridothelium virens TaxID=1048519 RepID=A0A6A6HID5_VIRVR|nr:hypothetical protein EV356DRAFT_510555 [Viridothelium virens]
MPTALDRAMQSKTAFWTFAGIVGAVSAWSIWGSEMFPKEKDPKGDPNGWTDTELRRWLQERGLLPNSDSPREELLERVKANMRTPRT